MGGDVNVRSRETGQAERLGGIGEMVKPQLQNHREGEPLRGFRTPIARRIAYGD